MSTSAINMRIRRLSQERLNKRRISVTLQSTSDFVQSTKSTKKGVHFPLGVLMQLAVTNGDLTEIKQLVKDCGVDALDMREPSGLTPVMRAIFEGELDALKTLIDSGADLSLSDSEEWNVLHVAAAMDDYEAAELIICSYKNIESLVHGVNIAGERPIDLAESIDVARLLLNANLTHLRQEVELAKDVKKTITSEAQIESECAVIQQVQTCYRKNQPLDFIIQDNTPYSSLLHLAAVKNYVRLAQFLFENPTKVQMDIKDKNGWTPLHTAAYYNSIEVVLILLSHNANTEAVSNSLEKPRDLTKHELILELLSSPYCTCTSNICSVTM